MKPLHWTHFHIGSAINKLEVKRAKSKLKFKVVGVIGMDICIPKEDVKYLNIHGRLREIKLVAGVNPETFDIDQSNGYGVRMKAAFKKPFVAEILGSGYEKKQNETSEMVRHPRIRKIHHYRTWEDAVSFNDLHTMAGEKWELPGAKKLDGHARDVALLAKRYRFEMGESQSSASDFTTS